MRRALCLLLLLTGACGAEYMPSAAQTFEPRAGWQDMLLVDEHAPEVPLLYWKIGTVMARAHKSTHAIDACRKEGAKHGGDAVIANHIRGGEWQCTVLRRKDGAAPAATTPQAAAPTM